MTIQSFVGIDGCKAGWMTVILSTEGNWTAKVYKELSELWRDYGDAKLLLIDMPIGLPSCMTAVRSCDLEARQLLQPKRASSIFSAPIRELLDVSSYSDANALSKQLTSRGLSKQAWFIIPKIRELDQLLQISPIAPKKLRESHPELCFTTLSGAPMLHNKQTEAGYEERIELLELLYPKARTIVQHTLAAYPRKAVARDDIVDALVLAISALLSRGNILTVPFIMERDETGLPMQITYPPKSLAE
ncbi:DUF429 domain-containing protein [Paenibacillus sp. FSL H7-0331]|uniref:DUF429 domain-containing protein n=1 Tax=Paenibacillus sp. FSL H7-0331 TaxID=1920421 RepID=UPI00096BFCF6|nr:DUF429 domain-containing protein [Paenibacillus sp. FSL H7-0331]OMF15788.1 hypothetical protein BK127_15810 [Paenibacillus sp. FSL H7-0331]